MGRVTFIIKILIDLMKANLHKSGGNPRRRKEEENSLMMRSVITIMIQKHW